MMEILYTPFGFILRTFYEIVGNYGLALFLFTLLFKIVLLPSSIIQQKGSAKQLRLQSRVKRIQQKYTSGNRKPTPEERQKMNQETQEFYQREGYSAMSAGCSSMLIQMPIIFGLIGVIYRPLSYTLNVSKEAVKKITDAVVPILKEIEAGGGLEYRENARDIEFKAIKYFDEIVKGGIDLSVDVIDKVKNFDFEIFGIPLGDVPSTYKEGTVTKWIIMIPIIAGLSSLISALYSHTMQKKNNPTMANNPSAGCMVAVGPIMSAVFSYSFPAGVGIYWIMSNILTFGQTVILSLTHSPRKIITRTMVDEVVERCSKEEMLKLAEKNKG